MKPDSRLTTVLTVGGIVIAAVFLVTAIVSPGSLDGILRPGDVRSERLKKEMERQKEIEARGRSDAPLRREEGAKSDAVTPTPTPEETLRAGEGGILGDERLPKLDCISRDQVVNIIGASEEAKESRVMRISVTPDGGRIMVAYRKKTFLGIGSGEHQIEGILQRGLRNRFPDRLIKSVKVRSDGKRSVERGDQNINVEVLVIESRQAGCRWP